MAPFVGGDIHDRPQTLPRPGFLVGVFLLRLIRREERQTRGAGGRGRRGAARAEEAAERRGKGGGGEDGGPDTYRRGMKMMGQEVRRFGRASSPVFRSAVCGSGTPESDKNYRSWPGGGLRQRWGRVFRTAVLCCFGCGFAMRRTATAVSV